MGRRGRKAAAIAAASEPTEMREALERRWRDRLIVEPRLATLVTAEGARREPFHRWISYKQGFSPGLVRQFLHENQRTAKARAALPVLDPFSGSGTSVVECARHGVPAIGVEAIAALVFLTKAMFERAFPSLPDMGGASTWEEVADRVDLTVHRAALMLAVGRRFTTAGRANRRARPLAVELEEASAMMRDDLLRPLPLVNQVQVGDARRLTQLDNGSIGGILTSPPYLSRHDYTQITKPYEAVYLYTHGGQVCSAAAGSVSVGVSKTNRTAHSAPAQQEPSAVAHGRVEQVRASPRAHRVGDPSSAVLAAEEAAHWLGKIEQDKLASVVRGYIEDMVQVLHECHRVLAQGGVCWMVIGGARIKGVYVPSDLMAAEVAEGCGLCVETIRVARDLVGSPRKFGCLGHVAPRESLLVMRRE